jgi:hypothetical protein
MMLQMRGLLVPVISKQLGGVRSANSAIAAAQITSCAIFVAAPAHAFGMLGMHRKLG